MAQLFQRLKNFFTVVLFSFLNAFFAALFLFWFFVCLLLRNKGSFFLVKPVLVKHRDFQFVHKQSRQEILQAHICRSFICCTAYLMHLRSSIMSAQTFHGSRNSWPALLRKLLFRSDILFPASHLRANPSPPPLFQSTLPAF